MVRVSARKASIIWPNFIRILSATLKENILFSHEYDETFYNLVVEACALAPDLALLPEGDNTEVGEKGSFIHLLP